MQRDLQRVGINRSLFTGSSDVWVTSLWKNCWPPASRLSSCGCLSLSLWFSQAVQQVKACSNTPPTAGLDVWACTGGGAEDQRGGKPRKDPAWLSLLRSVSIAFTLSTLTHELVFEGALWLILCDMLKSFKSESEMRRCSNGWRPAENVLDRGALFKKLLWLPGPRPGPFSLSVSCQWKQLKMSLSQPPSLCQLKLNLDSSRWNAFYSAAVHPCSY